MQRFLFTLLLLGLLSTSGLAQEVQRITLFEAIQISLDNNFELKQAQNNLLQTENDQISEYADFLPSVSSSLTGFQSSGIQFNQATGAFVNNILTGVNGSISGNLTLFAGLQNLYSLRAAQSSKLSQEENLSRAKETVIFNTATRYLQVLLDQQLLDIAKGNLETSSKQLEQIQAQVEVGTRPVVDLYDQEATVANDELSVTNQENTGIINRLLLVRQLQIDPTKEYEFVTPDLDTDYSSIIPKDFQLQALVSSALQNRSDLKSEKANIDNLKYQEKIAFGSLLPTLSLSGNISSRANDDTDEPIIDGFLPDGTPIFRRDVNGDVVLESVSFNDQFFDRNVGKSISLNLSVPIFQNWNRQNTLQRSKIQYKNATLSYDNTQLQVIQEVTQAYNDYVAVVKQLESTNKALTASQKSFETQQERYNVGASTLIELSQSQAAFVQAQANYTQAAYNFIFQEKLLDFFLGNLDENIRLD